VVLLENLGRPLIHAVDGAVPVDFELSSPIVSICATCVYNNLSYNIFVIVI